MCQIAHNVQLSDKTAVITGAIILGSVKTEENAYIAPSIIRNQAQIGANAFVGMGAVVTKDVPENDVVAGVPAKSIKI